MNREEHFITTFVMPWIRGQKNSCFEAKETDTSIDDSSFEPQQLPSLRKANSKTGLSFKIPDGSGRATPFDGINVCNMKAYVAIMYRGKGFCFIKIKDWDSRKKKKVDWEYAKTLTDKYYFV